MSDDETRRCNNCLETGGVVRMWGSVHWCRQCANGPIMDSNALYLPAGKLSKAEADARDRAALTQTKDTTDDA